MAPAQGDFPKMLDQKGFFQGARNHPKIRIFWVGHQGWNFAKYPQIMTTRQRLDIAVRSVTGEDIRFAGNWDPLPGLSGNEYAIADRLNLDASRLRRCRDIYEILELMEINPSEQPRINDAPSLF